MTYATTIILHVSFLISVFFLITDAAPVWERLTSHKRHSRARRILAPDDQCAAELWTLENGLTQIVDPIDLQGHWVSKQCEIHPGPKYVLRDYQFYKNGNFLVRHYEYTDDTCTSPWFGFTANGNVLHLSKSWAVPGGTDSTFSLSRVTVVPYTKSAAKALTSALRGHCRLEWGKAFDWPWLEEYRDYVIYNRANEEETVSTADSDDHVAAELDCLDSANFTVTHLGLLRMDEVMDTDPQSNYFIRQLYLGKVVRDERNGSYLRPSSFQSPLADADQIMNCKTCQRIKGSNPLSPPRLKLSELTRRVDSEESALEQLTRASDQLDGDWLSTGCESYEHGMYGHRRMTFTTAALTWHLRQRYYNDPLCKHPSFTLLADGRYSVITEDLDDDEMAPTAERLSYKIERVKLVPESRTTVHNLRRAQDCGPGHKWRQGRAVDISAYGGCAPLGIAVPAVTKDIVKIKPMGQDARYLFTGDYATVGMSSRQYPTSFQSPLIKCAEVTVVVSLDTPESSSVVPPAPNVRYGINYSKWQSNGSTGSMTATGTIFALGLLYIINSM